jgi:hypothetical protein
MRTLLVIFILIDMAHVAFGQVVRVHINAHAHNDYEHRHPLLDALDNGFISVEADIHLKNGVLLVSHNGPNRNSKTLEQLYLEKLDSIVKNNGIAVYPASSENFYLMLDCKTEALATWQAIRAVLKSFPRLMNAPSGPVKIFLSGNRPVKEIMQGEFEGIAIDGRPGNLGKSYPTERMPIISDHYKNWSSWKGDSPPSLKDLERIEALAKTVHAEGKKLRLWAIPDNEVAWEALLKSGVDLINTDKLEKLNQFLTRKGL